MKNLAFLFFSIVCNLSLSFGQIKIFIGETKEQVKDYWSTEVSVLYFHDDLENEFYIMYGEAGIPEFISNFNVKGKCVSHSSKISFSEISIIQARLKKDGFLYNSKENKWTHPIKKVTAEINQYGRDYSILFESNSKEYLAEKAKAILESEKLLKQQEVNFANAKRLEAETLRIEIDTQKVDYSKVDAELKLLEETSIKKEKKTEEEVYVEVFNIVEEQAEFPGGNVAMMKFIQQNLQYPLTANNEEIRGKCFLKFIVNDKGEINNIEILKGVPGCSDCDNEAIRVVKLMPKWKPAKMNGQPVKTYFNLPFSFRKTSGQ